MESKDQCSKCKDRGLLLNKMEENGLSMAFCGACSMLLMKSSGSFYEPIPKQLLDMLKKEAPEKHKILMEFCKRTSEIKELVESSLENGSVEIAFQLLLTTIINKKDLKENFEKYLQEAFYAGASFLNKTLMNLKEDKESEDRYFRLAQELDDFGLAKKKN